MTSNVTRPSSGTVDGTVKVSLARVQAARLRLVTDRRLKKETPQWVQSLAQADVTVQPSNTTKTRV